MGDALDETGAGTASNLASHFQSLFLHNFHCLRLNASHENDMHAMNAVHENEMSECHESAHNLLRMP